MSYIELFDKATEASAKGEKDKAIQYYQETIGTMFALLEKGKKEELEAQRNINIHSILATVLFERYKVLPQISTLSSALIVFIAANGTLIQIKWFALASFIIMLLLIPISLFGLLYQLDQDRHQITKEMKRDLFEKRKDIDKCELAEKGPWILWSFFLLSIYLFILSLNFSSMISN